MRGPAWRRVRIFAGTAALILLLVAVVGFSLLTRFPDAAIVERAQGWPVVGPAAEALRERWLGPPVLDSPTAAEGRSGPAIATEPEVVVVTRQARPQVWVAAGTVLRAEPSPDAAPLGTIAAMANVSVVERRGEWAWVDYQGALGWVVPEVEGERPLPESRPDPVVPVAARPPADDLLTRGLQTFSRRPTEQSLGDYRLFTDSTDPDLLPLCREFEAGLEAAYEERFGVAPLGEPAEVVLLYSNRIPYETFWRQTTGRDVASVGHTDRGLVATYTEGRTRREVCATLVHELTHLVNRRAVGPALPIWLEEGLATDIAASHGGGALDTGLARLALRRGTLPGLAEFLDLDRAGFSEPSLLRVHYETSGLWIRFLLENGDLAGRFREFLLYLSQGGPYSRKLAPDELAAERATPSLTDDLVGFLGSGVGELDARFRRWLAVR